MLLIIISQAATAFRARPQAGTTLDLSIDLCIVINLLLHAIATQAVLASIVAALIMPLASQCRSSKHQS